MILKVTKSTDPIWKKKFSNVSKISPEISKLIADMEETLEFSGGVGLAAPQLGIPLRLFIVSVPQSHRRQKSLKAVRETFINPKIRFLTKEANIFDEGCLSIPGYRGPVSRPKELEIEYLNKKFEKKKIVANGFLSRVIQHEYDHLNCLFYVQRVAKKEEVYKFEPIRIVFFGTPQFSEIILKSMIGLSIFGEYEIPLVITSPDKKAGRGRGLAVSPVKKLATSFSIKVKTPQTLKGNQPLIENLAKLKPDLIILASYGKILPKEILDIPKFGSLNVHPSLLPKYRGASPIQTAILEGEKETGVTIMLMNEKLDEGDILAKAAVKIDPTDTYLSLSKKLALLSSKLLNQTTFALIGKQTKGAPQNHKKATYTKLLKREDGFIDWKNPLENLERIIRAYFPWPGVWSRYNGKILKLLPERKVQLEGKSPVSLEDFKRGHSDFTLGW